MARSGSEGRAHEDDVGEMEEQAPIAPPFLKALLGEWTTEVESIWGPGRARTTVELALDGTALVQRYRGDFEVGGEKVVGHGLGVYKTSNDGRTVTAWWFDNGSSEPMVVTGPIRDDGFEATGKSEKGPFTVRFERRDGGFRYQLLQGSDVAVTEVYSAARKGASRATPGTRGAAAGAHGNRATSRKRR